MKQHCLTLINYLKPMKKLSRYLVIALILIFFQCCTEPESYPKYYQIRNETGTDVFIKFYYSEYGSGMKEYESFNLKNNESSAVFYAMTGGSHARPFFILYTDSIDIYSNEKMIRREKLGIGGIKCPSPSLYCEENYNTIIKSEKGHEVHVYKMLKSDLE